MANLKPGATRVTLATSYEIYVVSNGARRKVGAIQNINPSETKSVTMSFEIGTAQGNKPGEPFELVPGLVTDKTLEVSRLKLFSASMLEAFGSEAGAQSLYDNSIPFDIEEQITIPAFRADGTPDPDDTKAVVKTVKIYRDCLISRLSSARDVTRGDLRETETATIIYRTIIRPAA